MKKVSIILPIYNGESYLENLNSKIRSQKFEGDIEIIAPVSPSRDNSYEVAKDLFDVVYEVKNFNHGLTRHEAALKSKGDYLVFITQDILPANDYWLESLIDGLKGEVVATYSRQIPYNNATSIERLTRIYNYPNYTRLCNKETIVKWGRKNIYYSDSSSATVRSEYIKLNGYNYEVKTNEDVVYVCNVIESGKTVLYNCSSKVLHSHNFNLRETWERYTQIGIFEAEHQDLLSVYSTNGEGVKLIKFMINALLKEKRYFDLIRFLFVECPIKLISYKLAFYKCKKQKEKKL